MQMETLMNIPAMTLGVTLISALALSLPAHAQQTGAQTQQARTTADSQCLESLNVLAQRMNQEGYWLAGYPGYGAGSPAVAGRAPPAAVEPELAPGTPAAPDGRPAYPGGAEGVNPWDEVSWAQRPHYEIRTLFRAANVLGTGGDEEACMNVASAVENRYDNYTGQLKEIGLEPQEITTWRQAEIAASAPIGETRFPRRVDDLIGADLRNAQDEDLGDIADVVLDAQTGDVQYVVVSRGGFFGIGSEDVAVPWEHLRVAPAMSAFVLPVDQEVMEQAPRIAREQIVDPGQTGAIQEVDSYWEESLKQ
jgi:sporulation protein YlmC with PRC-barrel domain